MAPRPTSRPALRPSPMPSGVIRPRPQPRRDAEAPTAPIAEPEPAPRITSPTYESSSGIADTPAVVWSEPPVQERPRARPPAAESLPPPAVGRVYQRGWFWVVLSVAVVAAVIIALVVKVADDAVPTSHTVVYRVTGDAPADISYVSSDGSALGSQQLEGQRLPWTHTLTVTGDSATVSVTATFHELAHQGRLACEILVDGKLVSDDAKTGTAFVGCDGSGYRGS